MSVRRIILNKSKQFLLFSTSVYSSFIIIGMMFLFGYSCMEIDEEEFYDTECTSINNPSCLEADSNADAQSDSVNELKQLRIKVKEEINTKPTDIKSNVYWQDPKSNKYFSFDNLVEDPKCLQKRKAISVRSKL